MSVPGIGGVQVADPVMTYFGAFDRFCPGSNASSGLGKTALALGLPGNATSGAELTICWSYLASA